MKIVKILKAMAVGILAAIAVLVVVAFFLPSQYKLSRTVVINAPDSVIYPLTANLDKWDIWTAWTPETDSTAVFEMKGPDGVIGTERKWTGEVLGNGRMVITELKKNQLLGYDLAFDEGKYKSRGQIIIESLGDSTRVTWTDEGDLGYNPVNRYFGLFMEDMMGPDFEKGLAKLKTVAELRKTWPAITETVIPAQVVIMIKDSAGPESYETVMGKGYGEISAFIHKNRLTATGHPFAVYLKWDSVTMFSVMDLGIAVQDASGIKPEGRIRIEPVPEQKVVMAHYFGPYDQTAPYYYALEKYCMQEKLEITGGPREIYVTDPMMEKDPMKVQTDIVFPVK